MMMAARCWALVAITLPLRFGDWLAHPAAEAVVVVDPP